MRTIVRRCVRRVNVIYYKVIDYNVEIMVIVDRQNLDKKLN